MACTLSNTCAKNLSKRTVLLQLIIKNVATCFFGTQCSSVAFRSRTLLYSVSTCNQSVATFCLKLITIIQLTSQDEQLKTLMGILKPQSNGPLYSNTAIRSLAVDG